MQQTILRPQPNMPPQSNGRAQSSSVLMIALTLFALAGLMIGFAVGVFTHQKSAQTDTTNKGTSMPVVSQKATPQQSPVAQALPLGFPALSNGGTTFVDTQTADGNTQYTVGAQAVDSNNKPLHAAGITFKLWLVQRIPNHKTFMLANNPSPAQTLTNITNPIPGKVQDTNYPEISGFTFTPTTAQVQTSDAQGQVTWKYTIAPSVPAGNYNLVILSDWAGKYYNWSWFNIQIQQVGNN